MARGRQEMDAIRGFALRCRLGAMAVPVLALTVACAVALSCRQRSQEPTDTLTRIKESGVIALGHRESSIPFSYYDDQQQVIGYSQEIMLKAVERIRSDLGLPTLQTKLVPVTSQNRIALVQNGTVDIECGSTTNNVERQKQVAFSNTIFVVGTRLMVSVESSKEIRDFPDLSGRTVVVTAGTTSERLLRKMNEDRNMNVQIISAKDHGESFLMLETGRAAAFMNDDVLLFGERAKAKDPDRWVVLGTPQSREAYGCMMRKEDVALKKLVDETIAKLGTSGELAKLFDKWFRNPIPPRGVNLKLPLSSDMETLFKNPTDRALDL
jgi:glutamate/aspartate transport system substrate-binding protein